MPSVHVPYPATPLNVDKSILEPSVAFRRQVGRVLIAIGLFVITYMVLITAGIALAALCAIGGIGLIVLKPMFITLMLGIGLAGLGVMVLFFLLKFLFKRHKVDRTGLIEITAEDQPRLFEFVRKLAAETQTPFPKRIYLSPDVNASVFYNSSFWSMFLPVRKNLQVGLGLVNSVTLSEFKAIIAHEFGHFSQRSMKLGSYVYNLNQIIFNLLYDNDDYQRTVERWGNASGYFALFAGLTIQVVRGIQVILRGVYERVNKQYLSLSRQMEFHADTVAASVSGANHLIRSLRRLDIADTTYNNVIGFYHEHHKEALKPENFYLQHRETMALFSQFHGVPVEHGLPQVDANSFARFNKARVSIKDQWASHPSTDDRENHLRSLKIETDAQNDSAWTIFNNVEQLQLGVTEELFRDVRFEEPVQIVNHATFRERYQKSIERYQLNPVYKGFFDSRHITTAEPHDIELYNVNGLLALNDILTDDVLALPYRKQGVENDLEMLKVVISGEYQVKNFEFDGRKYKAEDAVVLRDELDKELGEIKRLLAEADHKVIAWGLRNAEEQGMKDILWDKYMQLFAVADRSVKNIELVVEMHEAITPLYNVISIQQIERALAGLYSKEIEFKKRLREVIIDSANDPFISEDHRKLATEYLSKDWEYFRQQYDQQSLERLSLALYILYYAASERAFSVKAQVLDVQLNLRTTTVA